MAFSWVQVGGTGYDVEAIPNPRTVEVQCPACEKSARFVEKLLIKNLKVFGVPLVGLEKGRPVFECPHCGACIEAEPEKSKSRASEAGTAGESGSPPATLTQLLKQIEQIEFDVELWKRREALAREYGDDELLAEARRRRESAHEQVAILRDEVDQYDSSGRRKLTAASGGAAKVVFRSGDTSPADEAEGGPHDESAFAALKARFARRAKDDAETASTASTQGAEAGSQSAEGTTTSAASAASGSEAAPETTATATATPNATATATPTATSTSTATSTPTATSTAATKNDEIDDAAIADDFQRLKQRLADRKEPTSVGEEPATTPEPPAANGGDDDDPISALKKKLRRGPG